LLPQAVAEFAERSDSPLNHDFRTIPRSHPKRRGAPQGPAFAGPKRHALRGKKTARGSAPTLLPQAVAEFEERSDSPLEP
jgi:hypothetical protein